MTEEAAVEAPVESIDVDAVEQSADNMRPDFLVDKYKTVEDQAKAYAELNSQYGKQATEMGDLKKFQESASKIIGAPEDYALPESEDFQVDIEDPRYSAFKEFAKENNLSQYMFENGLKLFADIDKAYSDANTAFAQEELSKLNDADNRIKNVQDWMSANIPDHAESLADLLTTAAGVEGFEALLEKAGKAPVTPSESNSASIPSMEEIQAMQFAVDEGGNRKMRDPNYAAKVERLLALHVGKGEHQVFVG